MFAYYGLDSLHDFWLLGIFGHAQKIDLWKT